MTHPDIARRQNMEEESSDKLVCLERHGFLAVLVCIIPPSEGDISVSDGEEAVIADGDSMGIPAEVLKDAPGAIKGRFAIDDPLLRVEMPQEGLEVSWILEMTETGGKDKIPSLKAIFEEAKELTPEQCRHDPHGKEEIFAA